MFQKTLMSQSVILILITISWTQMKVLALARTMRKSRIPTEHGFTKKKGKRKTLDQGETHWAC